MLTACWKMIQVRFRLIQFTDTRYYNELQEIVGDTSVITEDHGSCKKYGRTLVPKPPSKVPISITKPGVTQEEEAFIGFIFFYKEELLELPVLLCL